MLAGQLMPYEFGKLGNVNAESANGQAIEMFLRGETNFARTTSQTYKQARRSEGICVSGHRSD